MKTTSTRRTAPAVRTIAVAAVLAAGLAGCASRTSTSATSGSAADGVAVPTPGAGAATPTTSAPATPTPSAPSTGVNLPSPGAGPSKPTGAPTASGSASAGTSTKVYSPAGIMLGTDKQTLSVPIEWGGCLDKPEIVVTAQDATKVAVEMKQVSNAGPGKMCPDHVQTGTATLTLSSPLAGRTLIDATTNAPLPVH